MGKLSRDTIPAAIKPPCKAAALMLAVLDDDDFGLIAEELAGGMSMHNVWEWIRPTLPAALSSSALQNHLTARCCCPPNVPLKGARG